MWRLLVVEMRRFEYWNGGGCLTADTPTLKSVEVINGGLEVREIQPWGL